MADRKKAKEQAIAESVEMAEMAKKPAAKPVSTPSERLKNFRLNPSQQDADAAPLHPSAMKARPLTAFQTHGPRAASLIEAAQVARANHLATQEGKKTPRPRPEREMQTTDTPVTQLPTAEPSHFRSAAAVKPVKPPKKRSSKKNTGGVISDAQHVVTMFDRPKDDA
jgi:hypothetical protein